MLKKFTLLVTIVLLSFGANAQNDFTINPTINSPVNGCYLSSTETITVFLVNLNNWPYAGTLEMGYSLNWGPSVTVSETIGSLPALGSYIYSFPVPDDFSACQEHNLKIWVNAPGDPVATNDTIVVSVISDCAPIVGSISGTNTVCFGNNVDTLSLGGYTGNVQSWEVSTDGGISWGPAPSTGLNSDSLGFTNITNEMDVRVIVGSQWGYCPDDTTAWHNVAIDQTSDAGMLPSDFDICDNGNGGVLQTTNFTSQIVDWLYSVDNGATWLTQGHPYDTISYQDFTDTMYIVVTAVNGVCPVDTSAVLTLNYIPGTVAGTITAIDLVCNFQNEDSLVTTGNTGDVIAWWYSLDSGVTWLQSSQYQGDSVYHFSGLSVSTMFAAEIGLGTCPSEFTTPHYLTVLPVDIGILPGDTTIVEGDELNLEGYGGVTYFWFPDDFMDDPNLPNPVVEPDFDMTYYCQITDIDGCSDTARIKITVVPDISLLLVPNLFTPNGDGFNDNWEIRNLEGFPANQVTVFNIYGQIVYEASPYDNSWGGDFDGSQLPDGTYFYILQLNDPLYSDPFQGVITIAGND
jgi:gliding motility-associated-like protein